MPFDTTPIIDDLKMLPTVRHAELVVSTGSRMAEAATIRPIPAWHSSLLSEQIDNTLRVLVRARELIADERRWCRRAFARGWGGIPVPVQSLAARSFCAVGAIRRAGRELGLSVNDARSALDMADGLPRPGLERRPGAYAQGRAGRLRRRHRYS
jgi:hypothetical protein